MDIPELNLIKHIYSKKINFNFDLIFSKRYSKNRWLESFKRLKSQSQCQYSLFDWILIQFRRIGNYGGRQFSAEQINQDFLQSLLEDLIKKCTFSEIMNIWRSKLILLIHFYFLLTNWKIQSKKFFFVLLP